MTEERVKRKLSAILSADAAGYSRLMGEDEVSTVKTLEAYRKVMADLIEQFRGRVVDYPGDNLLAEFSSVVDAVQCAVEIHEVIRAKNEELPENRRMLFRIGVNLGDVIEEGDHIYGDGVNIAARLEGLAEPGGICISGSAHEQIENKLALGYEYLGEHTVKNIAKPVKVYKVPMGPKAVTPKEEKERKTKLKNWQWTALGAAGLIIVIIGAMAIWNFYSHKPSIEPASVTPEKGPTDIEAVKTKKTIAVLPFVNLSSDKEQEYFVDGLSEELLNTLTQIPDLLVTARTSSFSFKGTNKKVQEIANELGVENILEGSVRKSGNALRISAQLIRAKDGFHLWSKEYDRELKDIFAVQDDIATAVASELKATFGIGKSLKQLGGTDNLKAYELYLIAKGQLLYTSIGQAKSALESIEGAIALDPNFALAWWLKSYLHLNASMNVPVTSAAVERDAGLRAAQKAIELEPNLAEGYAALGGYQSQTGNFIAAETYYIKTRELTSEKSTGTVGIAYITAIGYFEKAQRVFEEMVRNDPLNQESRGFYLLSFGLRGDIQRAEEEYERGRALFGDQWLWGNIFITDIRLGVKRPLSRDEIVYPASIFDVAKDHLDSPKEGLTELRRLYKNENLTSRDFLRIAIWAAYFGDPEFSLEAMEKVLKIQAADAFFLWLPVMHNVRQLPRFKKLVKDIGLVDYWNKFGWPDLCRPLDNGDFECD